MVLLRIQSARVAIDSGCKGDGTARESDIRGGGLCSTVLGLRGRSAFHFIVVGFRQKKKKKQKHIFIQPFQRSLFLCKYKVSLNNPGWPQTHDSPASAS